MHQSLSIKYIASAYTDPSGSTSTTRNSFIAYYQADFLTGIKMGEMRKMKLSQLQLMRERQAAHNTAVKQQHGAI